jgi:RNA-directed DNA polymerase
MKRYGNLWSKITSKENIIRAHLQARKGKSHYRDVKRVNTYQNEMLGTLQQSLIDKTFTTSKYEVEERVEGGKLRTIHKLPYYPDRIVQHSLLAIIGPILTRSLIRDTFQSISGRGTSDARRRIQKVMKSENPPKYALQLDIRKYYPSIDTKKLKDIIRQKIKCKDTLWLLDNIIDSHNGLPIGNYTSQILGNFYIHKVDWHMKHLGVKYYFRYCDDIIMMSDSKKKLLFWFSELTKELRDLSLQIKPDYKLIDLENEGLDFIGYIFFWDKTKLRKRIAKNFSKSIKALDSPQNNTEKILRSVASYKGWVKYINAKMFWRSKISNRTVKKCDSIFKNNPLRSPI